VNAHRSSRLGWAVVSGFLVLTIGLSACGKRGKLEPPKGEEKAYSYPLFYPAPDTVVPSAQLPAEEMPPALEESFPEEEPRRRRLSPVPFDLDRTRTETFR